MKTEWWVLKHESDPNHHHGFVTVRSRSYRVSFLMGPSKQRQVCLETRLESMMRSWGCFTAALERLRVSKDALEFMQELCDLVDYHLTVKKVDPIGRVSDFMKAVYKDVQCIGWGNVHNLDESLGRLSVKVVDCKERMHLMSIEYPEIYPKQPSLISADLPVHFAPLKPVEGFSQFKELVDKLQNFWDQMEIIDSKCWILEPDHPTPATTYRRIAVAKHVSVRLDVNPMDCSGKPELQFYGPQSKTNVIQTLWNGHDVWDPNANLIENLELALDLKFPQGDGTDEDLAMECSVCYAFQLESGATPDIICGFHSCSRSFHQSCLYEWIKSLPSSRTSLQTVYGQCPYCSNQMAVSISL